jgi:hypothetical protein
MGVARAKALGRRLQIRVCQHALDDPFPQSSPSMIRRHDYIAQVAKRRAVSDGPCETNLPLPVKEAKTDRVLD